MSIGELGKKCTGNRKSRIKYVPLPGSLPCPCIAAAPQPKMQPSAQPPVQLSTPKLLVGLGGGGFLLESQSLLRRLGTACRYAYIISEDCAVPPNLIGAEIHKMRPIALLSEPHWWQRVPAFLTALMQTYNAVTQSKPDCVLCVGSAMAVPLYIVARLSGIRTVFIESITRFDRPSMTAKLVSQ